MEGFDETAAAPDANPFDAGFDAPAEAAAVVEESEFVAAPAAPLDDSLFAGGDGDAADANSNGGGADPPPAVFAAPSFDDPRIEWDHKNEAVLAQRAQAETKAKQEIVSKAKAHLDKLTKERDALLSKRKATNRELERTSNVAAGAVPSGDKPWERVLSVITFNREDAKGQHVAKDTFKELSRFKTVLLSAKAANVPVSS